MSYLNCVLSYINCLFIKLNYHLMYLTRHSWSLCVMQNNHIDTFIDTTVQVLNAARFFYSDSNGNVHAEGFLYSPTAFTPAAWSVTRSAIYPLYYIITGPLDPYVYDTINVNTGGVWSTSTNKATITTSGTYHVDLTACMCGAATGCPGSDPNLELQVSVFALFITWLCI